MQSAIDGHEFMALDDAYARVWFKCALFRWCRALQELGVGNRFHRNKILRQIEALKDAESRQVRPSSFRLLTHLAAAQVQAVKDANEFRSIDYSELKMIRTLASGNFGTASLATWRESHVVVKTLKANVRPWSYHYPAATPICNVQSLTPQQLVDFKREAGMCERVGRHPNVVSFIGACVEVIFNPIRFTSFSPSIM
jgi:hypothetical protein